MAASEIITIGVKALSLLSKNKDFQRMICGEYSDGTPKSLFDLLSGETESPKQKKKKRKKKMKRREKMKRKKYKKFMI